MHRVVLALLVALVLMPGCFGRQELEASVANLTDDPVKVSVRLSEAREQGAETYNRTVQVAAHDETPLTDFPPGPGAYVVRVIVENGPRTVDALEWSRESGPDVYRIEVHEHKVEIQVITV